jgi:transposase InsO family protein
VGLDSYSDVTVAHRAIVYNIRPVTERLATGGGLTQYNEEGLVDLVDGSYSFRTIPALVANHPSHLPKKCMLLLGVPQLNDMDIQVDTHRKTRGLPLASYDPTLDFDADTRLQCHLSEKDLLAWADCHHATPIDDTHYTYLNVIYFDGLSTDEQEQLREASKQYKRVYDATKGGLPALANHPPVSLNFKEGWKHVSVPVPKWGPGAIAVLSRWAQEMLDSGLYTKSKSPSASRPHIVRKTPPNAPKDIPITKCSMRVCGDYRLANDQLQKSFPTTANGTDELAKLPGYTYYWYTDRFSMYNAYALAPGPSRELLAIHTPLGLIEPTRMVFGEMNAGTVACAATPAILRTLPDNAHLRTASYVDDHAQGSHTFAELLKGYTDFLALCERENWTLNATKTMVGFPSCPFFGFVVDKTGTRLADKNLDPVRRMVPPSNVSELRKTLGVFVQSSRFIPNYAHVVRPLTELTRSEHGKPVAFTWTKERQDSFDHVRNLLLDGIHLAPPDYRLPFHSGGDASNDGKAYGIFQYNDLPRDVQFTVDSHHATHTIVRLTETNSLHTIPHTTDTRHNIAWFSKVWSEADRKRAPFYLEADTLLWGLAKCRFWALSSPFPLYAFSDHLPLKWVRKCEKGPVSEFTIEQLSDLSWIHSYLPGPENSLFDALSRYPLLGPRVLAPIGLSDAVSTLLDHLPESLKTARIVRVFTPPHTQKVAQQVQAWRHPTNPIDVHSFTHLHPPPPNTELVLAMPRAEDAPRIAARLLATLIPFALLLPSDLAPRIADANQFPGQPDLQLQYKAAGKIMFLDSDHLWILGNMPSLSDFSKIFSLVLDRPSPLLAHHANTLPTPVPTLPTPVPTTLNEWRQAQQNEPDFLTLLAPDSLALCNGLTLFKDADFPSRILVPPSLREPLIRQHHIDLQHVSHPKVLTSLARYYFWPTMKADVRRVVDDCELCENEKAKRRLAHGLFSSDTTAKPRSRYSMDFQGQGLASTGETEALAIIDSFTKVVILIPLPDRQAPTLVPKLLDAIYFTRGSPDVIHSDDAPEFLSELMSSIAAITGTRRTTTCGHNPQSNGEIESWWRFWNRAMKFLSPSDYLQWPRFAQRICFAHNSVPHETLGSLSPFEMDHGAPAQLPFAPPDPAVRIPDHDDSPEISPKPSPAEFIAALQTSVQAFHRFAATHKTFLAKTTEERLNKHGIPAIFSLNDRVKIYVPPTHAQIQRTGRRSNHIVAWRGPCRVSKLLSLSSYEVIEECSGRTFQRTVINMRPFRASKDPPPPHHDLLSQAALHPGTIVAVRDTPGSLFHLAKVLSSDENQLRLHYLGTTTPTLDTAAFRLVWIAPDGKTVLKDTCPARHHHAVTGEIDTADLPDLLVASHLTLTSTSRLSRKSARLLFHLRDQLHTY